MATVNSIVFNAGSSGTEAVYSPGDPIAATVDWTPDSPSVSSAPFTLTAVVSDASGNPVATSAPASFSVDTSVAAGDVASVSDSGGRTWTGGAVASDGSGGETQTFSSVA